MPVGCDPLLVIVRGLDWLLLKIAHTAGFELSTVPVMV